MALVSSLRTSRSVTLRIARSVLLIVGVITTTVAFIGLIDEQLAVTRTAPWWYVGAAGIVVTLLALGSPRQS